MRCFLSASSLGSIMLGLIELSCVAAGEKSPNSDGATPPSDNKTDVTAASADTEMDTSNDHVSQPCTLGDPTGLHLDDVIVIEYPTVDGAVGRAGLGLLEVDQALVSLRTTSGPPSAWLLPMRRNGSNGPMIDITRFSDEFGVSQIPVLPDSTVVVANSTTIFGLTASGTELWAVPVPFDTGAIPNVSKTGGGRILVAKPHEGDQLLAELTASGTLLWTTTISLAQYHDLYYSGTAAGNDVILLGYEQAAQEDGIPRSVLIRVSDEGEIVLEADISIPDYYGSGEPWQVSPFGSWAYGDDYFLFAGPAKTSEQHLFKLNSGLGLEWMSDVDVQPARMSILGARLIADDGHAVTAIDWNNGSMVWTIPIAPEEPGLPELKRVYILSEREPGGTVVFAGVETLLPDPQYGRRDPLYEKLLVRWGSFEFCDSEGTGVALP